MSTYVYLTCLDHTPPLQAPDESESHAGPDDLARVAQWVTDRDALVRAYNAGHIDGRWSHFSNTVKFLAQHPTCRIGGVTEYGEDLGEWGQP